MSRRLIRLVVPTPDRRRVLARPNGLAGWLLPVVPVPGDEELAWTDEALDSAARAVGAPVAPVRELAADAWEVEARGRVPRNGAAWIHPDEAGRLGADAEILRRWAATAEG